MIMISLMFLGMAAVTLLVSRWACSPARQADAWPRCGKCNYNLTGCTSNRCSECGSLLIEAGIVVAPPPRTLRRVRAFRAIAAVVILILLVCAGRSAYLAFSMWSKSATASSIYRRTIASTAADRQTPPTRSAKTRRATEGRD